MHSIEDWFPVLGWKNIPHFGSIHDLTSEEILRFYFHEDSEIGPLVNNLLIGLRGEIPSHNIRIVGPPGIGKTSFIYYLHSLLKEKDIKLYERYHIYVFNCETVINDHIIDDSEIQRSVYKSLIELYNASKIHPVIYQSIETDRTISRREKINKLTDYYISNVTTQVLI